jgi:acyl-CoA reductase-like NAD-dependent aldehyde dehydrogenase
MVVKPSEVTSATTLMLGEILAESGLPKGVYNVVTGSGRTIGQALTEHPDVDMLSFTGSTGVGRSVVHAAADSNFKKLGLELGGKNPIIVFADADLEDAADGAAFGISFNSAVIEPLSGALLFYAFTVQGPNQLVNRSVFLCIP